VAIDRRLSNLSGSLAGELDIGPLMWTVNQPI
jgi:hypothetical protein